MEIEITVDYNMNAADFANLSKVYPLGKYIDRHHVHWFRLEIDGPDGRIKLCWFREWE